jgi:16S rRNA (adenine1518-N6/adenine1519-N6)-dimethyltransferase
MPLRKVITHYGLAARKGLGQHFLLDLNLTGRIVKEAGAMAGVHVIEIGPGPGGLTRSLLASPAAHLTAIEKDPRCVKALEPLTAAYGERFTLIEGDALDADLIALSAAPRAIIANLPYNVGTPLLLSWLPLLDQFQSLTLMLQTEVVDRLLAKPDTEAYCRLSVLTQFCATGRCVMKVPAGAFSPPPKVESSVVHLTPRKDRPVDVAFETLQKMATTAFAQPRKMLRTSLKSLGGEALLEKAGVDPSWRAGQLSLQAFEALSRAYRKGD